MNFPVNEKLIELFFGSLIALSIGSFYHTLIYRIKLFFYGKFRKKYSKIQKWKLIISSPSHCDYCDHKIKTLNLIPIIGYFASKKKCSGCGQKISPFYLYYELFFLLVFYLIYSLTSNFYLSLIFLFFTGHLTISIFTDVHYYSLDYENLLFIVIFGAILNFQLSIFPENFPSSLLVFAGFAFFYLLLYGLTPEYIGLGDVIFAPFLAFLSGYPFWIIFLNFSYLPAVIITLAIFQYKKYKVIPPIPMGVYFCSSIFLTYLVKIYLN